MTEGIVINLQQIKVDKVLLPSQRIVTVRWTNDGMKRLLVDNTLLREKRVLRNADKPSIAVKQL